jgi:N-acetylneuraminic acid mutarotase
MKIKRRYCSVGTLDGKIWVVGGYISDVTDQVTSTVEIYDPDTDSWTDGPLLDVPCTQAVAAVVKGRLYVMFSNQERTINYTTSIAPGEISWRSDPPPPYPIFQTDGCQLDNRIYMIIPAVGLIMYDPALQIWQTDFPAIPHTKAPRAAAVVNYKNQVWVISGTDVEDEKMVWCFSTREREWTQGPSVPQSIRWADGIEVNSKLYVFGGATYSERHEIFVFWNTIYSLNDAK